MSPSDETPGEKLDLHKNTLTGKSVPRNFCFSRFFLLKRNQGQSRGPVLTEGFCRRSKDPGSRSKIWQVGATQCRLEIQLCR